MPRYFIPPLKALCGALVLAVLLPVQAAGPKSPLIGKTREQAVEELGEPKSNIRVGAREMLFFQKVKLTLRNDVVIETEALPDESAPAAPPTLKRAAEATPPATAQPQQPAGGTAGQPATNPAADSGAAVGATATADAASAPLPAKPPEPTLSIKFNKHGAKPAPKPAVVSASAATPAPTDTKPVSTGVATAPVEPKQPAPVAPTAVEAKPVAVAASVAAPSPPVAEPAAPAAEPDTAAAEEVTAKPKVDPKKKAAIRHRWRLRRDAETEDTSVQLFSTQSYVLAAIVIIGGIAFVWWRRGQRQLALAATAVSHSPFAPPSEADLSAMFAAEQIGKLGQKKFERLVASYYMKTGVVAERTNAAPDAPVHIKIFWKGEPKPFAGVQCHANPPALIPVQPLEGLFEALTAADIRRGYVVTTGKFSVEARDFAAEKVFTLLSGDLFLEKLNALPPAARAELLKETNTDEPAAPAGAATA